MGFQLLKLLLAHLPSVEQILYNRLRVFPAKGFAEFRQLLQEIPAVIWRQVLRLLPVVCFLHCVQYRVAHL